MRDPWVDATATLPAYRQPTAPRRHLVRASLAALATGMIVLGLGLMALPAFEEAAGQWQQQELATERDASITRYGNALAAAYDVVVSDFEDPIVAFEIGALPRAADGIIVELAPATLPETASPPLPPPPAAGHAPASGPAAAAEPALAFDNVTIRIPTIGVDQAVVEGVGRADLKVGPGHYPGTALPGHTGNMVISGHRTTYTRPFHDVDLLAPGDPIIIDVPSGSFRYVVERQYVVEATDLSPLLATEEATLTLTTCTPKGSARKRLVVVARLDGPPVDVTT